MIRRMASLALALVLGLQALAPGLVLTASAQTDAPCQHHSVHTDACGYREEDPGSPCAHQHTDDCRKTVTACVHTHTPECYPEADPADPPSGEATNCPHAGFCSPESGCITEEDTCPHVHDAACGYAPAVEASPCTFQCTQCPQPEPEPEPEPTNEPEPEPDPVPSPNSLSDPAIVDAFPDPLFREYVSKEIDTDGSGTLSDAERAAVTQISLGTQSVASLQGVKLFPNLQVLSCGSGPLNTLDVSGLTALQELSCAFAQLTALNVTGCTSLEKLYCHNNSLAALDVSSCPALVTLHCQDNQIASLDLSACPRLADLACYRNGMTSLNLSGCTGLQMLSCGENALTALDVGGFAALTYLDCAINQLQSLNLSGCTALTSLHCGENQLQSLDLGGFAALQELYCYDNRLQSLNLSGCAALRSLLCYTNPGVTPGNRLTVLDVSPCPALEELNCHSNQLTSLDLKSNPNLTAFTGYGNQFSIPVPQGTFDLTALPGSFDPARASGWTGGSLSGSVLTVEPLAGAATYVYDLGNGMTETFTLVFTDNGIPVDEAHFPDPNFRSYVARELDRDGNGLLNPVERAMATSIYVSDREIRSLEGIEHFPALKTLNVSDNPLTTLDLSRNPNLVSLECGYTSLTELHGNGCTTLEYLDCAYSRLTKLDVRGCSALKTLYCHSNRLTGLLLDGCPALESLHCDFNQLTTLDLSPCPGLTRLQCSSNGLTALDVSPNPALTELWCASNALTSLDLSANPRLTGLNCRDNQYPITPGPDGSFDLATLPGTFDPARAGSWTRAAASGSTLTLDPGAALVTYTYDLGNGMTETFTLDTGAVTDFRFLRLEASPAAVDVGQSVTLTCVTSNDALVESVTYSFHGTKDEEPQVYTGPELSHSFTPQGYWDGIFNCEATILCTNGLRYTQKTMVQVGNENSCYLQGLVPSAQIIALGDSLTVDLELLGAGRYDTVVFDADDLLVPLVYTGHETTRITYTPRSLGSHNYYAELTDGNGHISTARGSVTVTDALVPVGLTFDQTHVPLDTLVSLNLQTRGQGRITELEYTVSLMALDPVLSLLTSEKTLLTHRVADPAGVDTAFSFRPQEPGIYACTARFTDQLGNEHTLQTETLLNVSGGLTLERVDLTPGVITSGQSVTFTAVTSGSGEVRELLFGQPHPVHYADEVYQFTDAPGGTFQWTPYLPGTYEWLVILTNDQGVRSARKVPVVVLPETLALEAVTLDKTAALAGDTVTAALQLTGDGALTSGQYTLFHQAPEDAQPRETATFSGTESFSFVPDREGIWYVTFTAVTTGGRTLQGRSPLLSVGGSVDSGLQLPSGSGGNTDLSQAQVSGLEAEAESWAEPGRDVVVTMTMDYVPSGTVSSDTAAIFSIANVKTVDFVEIGVTKSVDGTSAPVHETNTVLDIQIPFDPRGKVHIQIYRVHNGVSSAFTPLDRQPATLVDGTYYVDRPNGILHLYSRLYSLYGIGYDPGATVTYRNGDAVLHTQEYVTGQGLTTLYTPGMSGYLFDGWFADPALTIPVSAVGPDATQDIILYAAWRRPPLAPGENPYTGDPIYLAAAGMVLSGTALAGLLSPRRRKKRPL